VCHSCFDAPCQLNLQSFDGLDRGANVTPVYAPQRLEAVHPTRMFVDAQSPTEWAERFGFFPVVERTGPTEAPLERSLLWRSIDQRRRMPVPVAVDADGPTLCPVDAAALERQLRSEPGKGMPYGLPPLDESESTAIAEWLRHGAGAPSDPRESDAALAELGRWEAFLNDEAPRARIVARYVFEHLFLAHLSVESAPGEWFRVVRSRTAAPAPVDVIATVRPYDDPGVREPHYRLQRIHETIVEKTHAAYALSDAKLARLRRVFFDADWRGASTAFPSYAPEVAANPFVAFTSIPARARYQFLLDDAYYHVKTFIHGPVCKGQVALNVIDEHFLIFFLAPDADPSVTRPDFLPTVAEDLAVPAQGGEGIEAIFERFKLRDVAYLRKRAAYLAKDGGRGHVLGDIWNGDGTNRDAVLTVYRHFDSAAVLRGAVGGIPKTAWVLDYPILERMYYDLVAGFDVFGNLVHQVSTRRYMNLLRMEAESGFLGFLPLAERPVVRDSWYRPPGVSTIVDVLDPMVAAPETAIAYPEPARAKDELVTRLVTAVLPRDVVGPREGVQWTDVSLPGSDPASRFERAVRAIVRKAEPFVRTFPDATLVRVLTGGADDPVYTVVRNKAHLNIDFMFLESEERVPAEDTLHVVPGIVASRPNLFLTVPLDDVERFVHDVAALHERDESWARFLARYGVRRRDPAFWSASDFFNDRFPGINPVDAGILDLSRYVND